MIVQALNTCYDVHFPERPATTVMQFREEMGLISLWPSNTMVVLDDSDPIAVIVGTKRPYGCWIAKLGVRSDHQRQGIGRYIVEALMRKLSIIGPRVISVDVPVDNAAALAFFQKLGFETRAQYWSFTGRPQAQAGDELRQVHPIKPDVALSRYETFHLGFTYDTRNESQLASSGIWARFTWERSASADVAPVDLPNSVRDDIPTDGSYTFHRIWLDARSYNRITPAMRVNLRAVGGGWIGGDPLSLQRRLSLGGPDILPGYSFRWSICDQGTPHDAAMAAGMKSSPLTVAPWKAPNTVPGATLRLSMAKPVTLAESCSPADGSPARAIRSASLIPRPSRARAERGR